MAGVQPHPTNESRPPRRRRRFTFARLMPRGSSQRGKRPAGMLCRNLARPPRSAPDAAAAAYEKRGSLRSLSRPGPAERDISATTRFLADRVAQSAFPPDRSRDCREEKAIYYAGRSNESAARSSLRLPIFTDARHHSGLAMTAQCVTSRGTPADIVDVSERAHAPVHALAPSTHETFIRRLVATLQRLAGNAPVTSAIWRQRPLECHFEGQTRVFRQERRRTLPLLRGEFTAEKCHLAFSVSLLQR
ncbi:hypothetical protein HPB51_020999 [Rhipicephalus microplus]|uniref:Uncharacterized protein n=1 Tax=Rhipicephalus microplus TaxID=6941 RepID=A0A9J6DC18_RHIMP|nr:hypothetical protein HPB51_020999 [Rhipicephalus microplus]